jgi:hypothetical protein
MSWYVVDVIDKAFDRSKKCLIEPFDFWKWVKIAIIIMLIGGTGSSYTGGSNNYSPNDVDSEKMADFFENGFEDLSAPNLLSNTALLIGAAIFILLIILFFSYVSSLMEFVFVESLVSNDVRFWEYSRMFLGNGLGLFILRFIIGLIILIPIIAAILLAFISTAAFSFAGTLAFIALVLPLILILALISGAIGSFINLSIPVSLYNRQGIFSALKSVFGRFMIDWKQIVIYWIGRAVLAIAVGIIVMIAAFIVILALGLISLAIDGILYFILAAIGSGEIVMWIILGLVIFVQVLLLIALMLLIAVPGRVFMKYHMLTFLEEWYPEIDLPMFDAKHYTENMNQYLTE